MSQTTRVRIPLNVLFFLLSLHHILYFCNLLTRTDICAAEFTTWGVGPDVLKCSENVNTVFFWVSAHTRVSAHPLFLAFLVMWEGTSVSAHPSPFDLEACADIQAIRCQKRQIHTVLQVHLVQVETAVAFTVTRQVFNPPRFKELTTRLPIKRHGGSCETKGTGSSHSRRTARIRSYTVVDTYKR